MISVIIPVWNHAKELRDCLQALTRQTYKDFEVIVVDDASPDRLEQQIESYRQIIPFQYIHFPENRGAPAARNEGFTQSRGEYLIFLDADTILEAHTLERMKRALEEHPDAAYAYSSFYFGWKLFKSQPFDAQALRRLNYIQTTALIRRTAFPGFDESLKKFQDWDLWLTMSERGAKGWWIPETLFRVKPRREGMSQWVPAFCYRIPWTLFNFTPSAIKKYQEAENGIRKKHRL